MSTLMLLAVGLTACGIEDKSLRTWALYGNGSALKTSRAAIEALNERFRAPIIAIDNDTPNTITIAETPFEEAALAAGEAVGFFDGNTAIYLVDFYKTDAPEDASLLQRRTTLHEIGHAFGLNHVFKASAIMSPDIITADIPEAD